MTANEKRKAEKARKKPPQWNVTTHTEYIRKESDFPKYYKPQGDILSRYSKEDREKLFQNNLVEQSDSESDGSDFQGV